MQEVGDPKSAAFDAVCLHCKRRLEAQEGEEAPEVESESDDNSSSTASEGFEPVAED